MQIVLKVYERCCGCPIREFTIFFKKNQQALYRQTTTINERDSRMYDHCPGAANLRTPTLTVKKCPQCGDEVEVFSHDVAVKCTTCGFVVYNDIASCIQ